MPRHVHLLPPTRQFLIPRSLPHPPVSTTLRSTGIAANHLAAQPSPQPSPTAVTGHLPDHPSKPRTTDSPVVISLPRTRRRGFLCTTAAPTSASLRLRCPSSLHPRPIRTRSAGSAASHARGPPWLSAALGALVRPRSSGAGGTAERRSGQVPLLRGRRVGCASAPGVPGREGGRRAVYGGREFLFDAGTTEEVAMGWIDDRGACFFPVPESGRKRKRGEPELEDGASSGVDERSDESSDTVEAEVVLL
nr:uncharacterized protein LOC109750429 [Aegilops tauschii subsp. strangulata]